MGKLFLGLLVLAGLSAALAFRPLTMQSGAGYEWKQAYAEGRVLLKQDRLSEGFPKAEEALTIAEEQVGPDHPDLLDSIELLAEYYDHKGEPDRAQAMRARAETIKQQL